MMLIGFLSRNIGEGKPIEYLGIGHVPIHGNFNRKLHFIHYEHQIVRIYLLILRYFLLHVEKLVLPVRVNKIIEALIQNTFMSFHQSHKSNIRLADNKIFVTNYIPNGGIFEQ